MAFQVQKVFGTFDKQAPGARFSDQNLYSKKKNEKNQSDSASAVYYYL